MSIEHWWNGTDCGEPKYSGEKPVPVSLCPPQISHGPARGRTRASSTLRLIIIYIIFKYLVPTSQETRVSITYTSNLIFHRKFMAVCRQNQKEHIDTLRGQDANLCSLKLLVYIVTTKL
jgi:hypothetical protein